MPGPLRIDPIAEARRHWTARWGTEPARPMAAVTSIMRAQQVLLARLNDVLRPFGHHESDDDVFILRIELRHDLRLIETFRLIEGLKRLDAVFVVAAFCKKAGLLHIHVLHQFVFVEMLVPCEGDIFDLLSIALHDPVKNRHAIRVNLGLGVDLDIEVTLLAKLLQKVLTSFLNHFGRETILLIDRQQLVFCPWPQVRALNLRMHDGAGMDFECNVGPVGLRIVVGADQFHLRREMIFAL